MCSHGLTILKFGSSVLRNREDLTRAVHEIYRWVREGDRVLAVVSAFGGTTNKLLEQAFSYGGDRDEHAVAALVGTGEETASALLSVALDRAGICSMVLDAARISLRTNGPVLDAEPASVDEGRIWQAFRGVPVCVVPGFIGRTHEGSPSLLGRGGSDLTALFLAQRLGAGKCRLIKDVNGLYEHDPADDPPPLRYRTANWDDALRLSGRIVQHKAIRFAKTHRLSFEVGSLGSADVTVVGPGRPTFYSPVPAAPPLKVGLLGLGTVGLGVYRELTANPDLFEITGVAMRNVSKNRECFVSPHLLHSDPWEVVRTAPDVVIEAIGGQRPAGELIAAALANRAHVVTANKAVIAHHGPALSRRAAENGRHLLFSAAVGGAVPMLESVARLARTGPVTQLEGVINGTSTFILDQVAQGQNLADAVTMAQQKGFAEQNPTFDLDGTDAAQKLVLLARAAFGADLDFAQISRSGIANVDPKRVREIAGSQQVLRLVASVKAGRNRLFARVGAEPLEATHPLARARCEQNCLLIHRANGEAVLLHGKGAGRWPTTESMMADLFAVTRQRQALS